MPETLKEAAVREKHEAVLACIGALDLSLQELMMLVPEGEPKTPGARAPKMFTAKLVRSAQRISDFLQDVNLHSLVVAQEVMNFTDEAREAAIAAQKGKFKIVGEGETDAKE